MDFLLPRNRFGQCCDESILILTEHISQLPFDFAFLSWKKLQLLLPLSSHIWMNGIFIFWLFVLLLLSLLEPSLHQSLEVRSWHIDHILLHHHCQLLIHEMLTSQMGILLLHLQYFVYDPLTILLLLLKGWLELGYDILGTEGSEHWEGDDPHLGSGWRYNDVVLIF